MTEVEAKQKSSFKGKELVAHVTHGKDGYTLMVNAESPYRQEVVKWADRLCALTRHKFCHKFNDLADWADQKTERLWETPISLEDAKKLSWIENLDEYHDYYYDED